VVSNETYCPHCKAVVTLSDLLTFLPGGEVNVELRGAVGYEIDLQRGD